MQVPALAGVLAGSKPRLQIIDIQMCYDLRHRQTFRIGTMQILHVTARPEESSKPASQSAGIRIIRPAL